MTDAETLLASAKCYTCFGVNEDEALELALLSAIANAEPSPTAPVLSYTFPDLSWTFSGANPDHWSIQESNNGVSGWTETDTAAGSARAAVFVDTNVFVRIVGENAGNIQTIPPSNNIFANGP